MRMEREGDISLADASEASISREGEGQAYDLRARLLALSKISRARTPPELPLA